LLDKYQLRDRPAGSAPLASEDSLDSQRPRGRGRLRVYLGMAAGVGKTYAMLNEGQRRKARGTDVVIGYVETHHRPITEQQIGTLEIVPRRRIPYRGVTLEEMDVDAVIARQPQVALVDELAHTNAPGSAHTKRYEDVEDLLQAGITVITTLNIQHLEGLNDIVEAITGVRQRETLPDRVLDEADEVELVDIAPDALRARLRHGNVYPQERAVRALENYFSQSNLTALRELALRRTAEKTESQLEALMRGRDSGVESPWVITATDRILVAFDARPHAREVLRAAWRLARSLKAPLLAVTVRQAGVHAGERAEAALREHIRLAEDLGAEVFEVEGREIVSSIMALAKERHVTQIVLGQPSTGRWSRILRPNIVDQLLALPLGAELHIVPERDER
jgi:two-component system sensor histidine kinase KdpD